MTFLEMAARLDALEEIQSEWPGLGPKAFSTVIAAAEAEVLAATPSTAEDRAWLYARFERSIANDWTDETKGPLLSALGRAA